MWRRRYWVHHSGRHHRECGSSQIQPMPIAAQADAGTQSRRQAMWFTFRLAMRTPLLSRQQRLLKVEGTGLGDLRATEPLRWNFSQTLHWVRRQELIDQMILGEPMILMADGAFLADYGVPDFGIFLCAVHV